MTSVMTGQTPPTRARIVPARPEDTEAVLGMLERCSRASLFRRFHSPSDGVEYTKTQLRRDGDIVYLAWEGDLVVGMGVFALEAREDGRVAHLGVLVEDDCQRHGIGRRLVAAAARDAVGQGIRSVHADVMGDDVHLVRALRGLGSLDVELETGEFSVDITLAA